MLIVIFVIVFPIAWLISEFFNNRLIRIGLGVCAISMCFGVAWIVGSIDRVRLNIYSSSVTMELIHFTIEELERGKSDEVIKGLIDLRSNLHLGADKQYPVLVDRYVRAISATPQPAATGIPPSSQETGPSTAKPMPKGEQIDPSKPTSMFSKIEHHLAWAR